MESSSHVWHTNCVRAWEYAFPQVHLAVLSLALFVLMIRHTSLSDKSVPYHHSSRLRNLAPKSRPFLWNKMNSSNTNNAMDDGKAHVQRRPNPPEVSLRSRRIQLSLIRVTLPSIPRSPYSKRTNESGLSTTTQGAPRGHSRYLPSCTMRSTGCAMK